MSYGAEIITVLIAMAPIGELRAAIPVGVGFGLPLGYSVFLSVTANLVSGVILLLLLEPVANFLRHYFKIFERFFSWLFKRTRRKAETKLQRFGHFMGIFILVAIPLPGTGVWMASAAAFVFGIKFKIAFPAMLLGLLVAATLTFLATLGVISLL